MFSIMFETVLPTLETYNPGHTEIDFNALPLYTSTIKEKKDSKQPAPRTMKATLISPKFILL